MIKSAVNSNYSKSTINELYHFVKSALIEEQLGLMDNSAKLSLLYEELSNRDRLDVYNEAVSSAIHRAVSLQELKSASSTVKLRGISGDSQFELTELLRKAFIRDEDEKKTSSSLQLLELLKVFGMDENSFICDVTGQSMIDANIFEGDTLIVNPNKKVLEGDYVVVKFDTDIFVKRFVSNNGIEYFASENPEYQPFPIDNKTEFEILGVVKSVIHKY